MAAYLDMAAANAGLKELYGPQYVQTMAYTDNPWFGMIAKDEGCGGKVIPFPTVWNDAQGRSANFAIAQANQQSAEMASFLLTLKPNYQLATITNQLVEASQGSKEAFLSMAKLKNDAALRNLTNDVASSLFRSGTGSIGKVSSITTGVITLSDPETVTQFARNQVLQANATDGGASPRAAKGYVIAVNRTAGTVTVASSGFGGAAATPAAWVANDFLLVEGDNNAKPAGLAGWIPATAPVGGDNFFGVDRSADNRLYGMSTDQSSLGIEEGLIEASKFLAREEARTNIAITNYTSYTALEKSLGTKVQYVEMRNAQIAFKGITLNGFKGPIDVFPDRNCPGFVCYLLQQDTWKLCSTNEVPHVSRGDGLDMLRVGNADALETRWVAYYQPACNAPGWNAQVTLIQ